MADTQSTHGATKKPRAKATAAKTSARAVSASKATVKKAPVKSKTARPKSKPKARDVTQLSQAEIHRLQRADLLLGISRHMAGIETLDEVLRELVEIVSRETNAERSSLFLNDMETGELYTRVAQGKNIREIRILNDSGRTEERRGGKEWRCGESPDV